MNPESFHLNEQITRSHWDVSCDTELPKDLKKAYPLAFVVLPDNFRIIISRSGHSKITRENDIDKRDAFGGWIQPANRKIIFRCGALNNVPSELWGDVERELSNFLQIHDLRRIDNY